jgi:hypothetical protein
MAKVPDLGSDFAQKLLRDLRRRRERLGFDSTAAAPRARGKLSSFLADRVAGARFQVELFEFVTISSRGFATILLRSCASPIWYYAAHICAILGLLFFRTLLPSMNCGKSQVCPCCNHDASSPSPAPPIIFPKASSTSWISREPLRPWPWPTSTSPLAGAALLWSELEQVSSPHGLGS